MGGRFGKYGDLKRKAALRRSRKEKGRLQKGHSPHTKRRRKDKGNIPQPANPDTSNFKQKGQLDKIS